MRRYFLLPLALFFSVIFIYGAFASEGAMSGFYGTAWSLLPPVVAIALALITKEVYISLLIGILTGGLLCSEFTIDGTIEQIFNNGFIRVLSDQSNQIIIIFILMMAMIIVLMQRTGGSEAFGEWASKKIKSRRSAQLSTILLGVLIFIDDYFNCLTVGSVMRPVTEKNNISRAKLAYLLDATAAPVCIIAPISSWAAAVSSYADDDKGLSLFIRTIPYNFYSFLTIAMMVTLALIDFDFGPMKNHEYYAQNKELEPLMEAPQNLNSSVEKSNKPAGKIMDLIFPVVMLTVLCVLGIIYSGGFFAGNTFTGAFADADAAVGLALGSSVALILMIIYILLFCRRTMNLKDIARCVPDSLKMIIPPLMILILAWTLKTMTDALGSKQFIETVVQNTASGFRSLLPAIIFAISCFIAFATGTSWGTFGILIPITLNIFPLNEPLGILCVSASLAGAVCGDHCSPISDTTIAASLGAQCEHVVHVATQLPYALTAAFISFITYLIAGYIPSALISLPGGILLMVLTLLIIKKFSR